MTKILALDSSTDACSVALHIDGACTHLFELAAKSHTQRLLPMVDEILAKAGCHLNELDAIAYGRGPGSFTGLRICMGVVQGLAFGANLPVLPISTLQAIACGFMEQNPNNHLPILAALDARMDEVYWGLFSPEALPQTLVTDQVMKPGLVHADQKLNQLGQQFIGLGSGWHYQDLINLAPDMIDLQVYPNAQHIATLAFEDFNNNQKISIMDAQPVYLRDSVSWQKRQRIRTNPIA